MKKLISIIAIMFMFMFVITTSSFAKTYIFTETFDTGTSIEYTNTPVLYNILADGIGDTRLPGDYSLNYISHNLIDENLEIKGEVVVKNFYLKENPKIIGTDPLNQHKGVFHTGTAYYSLIGGNKWTAAAGLKYDFDVLMKSFSVSVSYLNNRNVNAGWFGFVAQEVDENEKVLWEGICYIASNGTGKKKWVNVSMSAERMEILLVRGHKFNRLYVVETYLYDDRVGGGYFDDLTITTESDEVEVAEEREISSSFVSTGTKVIITPDTKEAFYNHILYATVNGVETRVCNTADIGTPITLGPFPVGTPIDLRLHVTTVDQSFYTGDASNNPDGLDHCQMIPIPDTIDTWELGFEDMLNNGDADFNDCTLIVEGVQVVDGR